MGDMNFSLTTFNKTGKLLQIEYALARVQQGKMALGIRGKVCHLLVISLYANILSSKARNGVVIATDKKVNSVLVDNDDYQKIQMITPSTGTFHYSSLLIFDMFLMFVHFI
jgi:20S proteasome subunit alpha 2